MAVARATVAYDGTDFFGWARQPGLRTVEGVLGDVVGADLTVAGRTDRGVHALANVVSFQAERIPTAGELNARLPVESWRSIADGRTGTSNDAAALWRLESVAAIVNL